MEQNRLRWNWEAAGASPGQRHVHGLATGEALAPSWVPRICRSEEAVPLESLLACPPCPGLPPSSPPSSQNCWRKGGSLPVLLGQRYLVSAHTLKCRPRGVSQCSCIGAMSGAGLHPKRFPNWQKAMETS